MAKERKGQEGASRFTPRWSPPAAADINAGDTLQYYSIESCFRFQVLSVQHGGEWLFGAPEGDETLSRGGLVAVKRENCMTLETAERVLHHLPTLRIEAPPLPELPG